MNLVGKIFVVLIFVMSLVFMAFAMAVYATHRNWREEVTRPRERLAPAENSASSTNWPTPRRRTRT